jgi:hypothetical protein
MVSLFVYIGNNYCISLQTLGKTLKLQSQALHF